MLNVEFSNRDGVEYGKWSNPTNGQTGDDKVAAMKRDAQLWPQIERNYNKWLAAQPKASAETAPAPPVA